MSKRLFKAISNLLAVLLLLTLFLSAGITDTFASDAVINIYVAGDSTVKTYNTETQTGGWGEFLQTFFNSNKVKIVNYANGGRSSRSFINEGSLQKIAASIKKGDYLLIQFGHNDCANSSTYLQERFVSIGTADAKGVYPSQPGVKTATPSNLSDRGYGGQYYPYTSGTYKWYLQQYIDTAKKVGATPILVTSVSRQYFNTDGTIKPHHDATDKTTGTIVTSNNAYVTAVKQLGQEQGVKVIDMFTITKNLFETVYKEDSSAGKGTSPLAKALMATGDSTHCNKLGGFYEGGLISKEIQKSGYNISQNVILPVNVKGLYNTNLVFGVDSSSKASVYTAGTNGAYTSKLDTYWTQKSQSLINSLYIAPTFIYGDVNGDNSVDALDLAGMKAFLLGKTTEFPVESGLKAADLNGDTKLDALDFAVLKQYLLGKITALPVN